MMRRLVVFRIRVPVRLELLLVIQMNMFGFAEFVQAFFSELAGMSGLTHAAEGAGIIIGQRIVDPERSRRDAFHRFHRPFHIVRINIRAEAVGRIIGKSDGFVDIAHAHDRQDRAESLRPDEPHVLANVDHHGRLIKEAFFELRRCGRP